MVLAFEMGWSHWRVYGCWMLAVCVWKSWWVLIGRIWRDCYKVWRIGSLENEGRIGIKGKESLDGYLGWFWFWRFLGWGVSYVIEERIRVLLEWV